MRQIFTVLAFVLAMASPLMAQTDTTPVTTTWELFALPGGGNVAVLWLTPGEGFKAYGNDPGQAGMPTRAEVRLLPEGKTLPVLYPPGKPSKDLYEPDKAVNVYDHPTPLFMIIPKDAPAGFGLEARVSLLACTATSCWPTMIESSFSSREVPNPAQADAQPWWDLFRQLAGASPAGTAVQAVSKAPESAAKWEFTPAPYSPGLEVDSLLKALPLAILAGIILNLMPCVLPVACLKLSGLLASCGEQNSCDRCAVIREHNLFFAAGVLGYFCLLAAFLGLAGMAWGQLFQQPGLLLGASVILFALGLSLFGVFHLPVIDLKFVGRTKCNPKAQALCTGFLATLLATPCSGPFLGGVLAWTLMQPVAVVVTVFAGIGLGMASPYLVLAARPDLVRFVPRPGTWMTHLEKIAAFLIMGTCLYFLSILPQSLLLPSLLALLVTAVACHAWGSWTNLSQGAITRWTIRLAAVALTVAACVWALSPPSEETGLWQAFDKESFNKALGKENLLVDFTADWCPTCKALEKTVLRPSVVDDLKKRHGLTTIRVDMTREDPDALALLRALGSASIPVAAVFPKGEGAKKPVVLRDLFTSGQLEGALKQALKEPK